MSSATAEVIEMADKYNVDLRTGAYILSINRLNSYYLASGLIIWNIQIISGLFIIFKIKYYLTNLFRSPSS